MDIKTDETTMSMTKKGIKMMNPISKAFFNSLMTKAGINTQVETSAGVLGRLDLESATKRARLFLEFV